jgi:hypothetical protein
MSACCIAMHASVLLAECWRHRVRDNQLIIRLETLQKLLVYTFTAEAPVPGILTLHKPPTPSSSPGANTLLT